MVPTNYSDVPENWQDLEKVTCISTDTTYTNRQRATLCLLEKTGRVYYYLRYVFDGSPHSWVDQKRIDEVTLLEGFRPDIVETLRAHENASREHNATRDQVQREKGWQFEKEKRNAVAAAMVQWDTDNPAPTAPELEE